MGKEGQPGTHLNRKFQQGINFVFQWEITSSGVSNWKYVFLAVWTCKAQTLGKMWGQGPQTYGPGLISF